jgi:DtxR family transcriptional regulator, Mn-dependent transcriptional regulator
VLTGDGEAAALKIIRNHRLLELFLQRTLGYTWDEVHAEADRLEHVISDEMEERIAIALGNPSHDPHGEPIPTRDLQLPPVSKDRLSESRPGDHVIVERVEAADLDLLRYLGELGLMPDAEVKILGYSIYDENLHMQVKGQPQPVVLGPRITRQIYVKVIK